MRSKKTRVLEEPTTDSGMTLNGREPLTHLAAQGFEVIVRCVGQCRVVQVGPKGFDGIQLRGVGRQPVDAQPGSMALERGAGEAAAVGGKPIPEEDDGAPPMSPQRLQETDDVTTVDAAATEGQEPAQALAGDRGEHGANRREALPIERLAQARGLSLGRQVARTGGR